MKPVRALVVYVAAVFLLGALTAPWLYRLAQAAAQNFSGLEGLAGQPFHRFVTRAILLWALLGLWPFLRAIGVDSWQRAGLVSPAGQWRRLGLGFAVGLGTLGFIGAMALVCGARIFKGGSAAILWAKAPSALLSAVTVGVLEEILYRGALFGALRRAHHWGLALVLSSGLYALTHFFQRPQGPAEVKWDSGLALVPQMLRGFVEFDRLVPEFFVLALAGMILGLAYQRTGTLFFSIGVHSGWVFSLKLSMSALRNDPSCPVWFWGTPKVVNGWASVLVLGGLFGLLWRFLPRDTRKRT